jgi:hypothetical protein
LQPFRHFEEEEDFEEYFEKENVAEEKEVMEEENFEEETSEKENVVENDDKYVVQVVVFEEGYFEEVTLKRGGT